MKDLAHRLEISESYLSLIEQGKRLPSQELLSNMSSIYDIEIDILNISVGRVPEALLNEMINNPHLLYKAICDNLDRYND